MEWNKNNTNTQTLENPIENGEEKQLNDVHFYAVKIPVAILYFSFWTFYKNIANYYQTEKNLVYTFILKEEYRFFFMLTWPLRLKSGLKTKPMSR